MNNSLLTYFVVNDINYNKILLYRDFLLCLTGVIDENYVGDKYFNNDNSLKLGFFEYCWGVILNEYESINFTEFKFSEDLKKYSQFMLFDFYFNKPEETRLLDLKSSIELFFDFEKYKRDDYDIIKRINWILNG